MILVANKVDLMHLRKITREQGKEMATKHNVGGVCVCGVCVCVWCVYLYLYIFHLQMSSTSIVH